MADSEEKLFHDFQKVTVEEWEQKINADLKGKTTFDQLYWESNELISIKPFYTEKDILSSGLDPKTTIFSKSGSRWSIRCDIKGDSIVEIISESHKAVLHGAEILFFKGFEASIAKEKEFHLLLKGLEDENVRLHFSLSAQHTEIVDWYTSFYNKKTVLSNNNFVEFSIDPFGDIIPVGNSDSKDSIKNALTGISKLESVPDCDFGINVHAIHFSNAGADAVTELAYGLALGSEYLDFLRHLKENYPTGIPKISFVLGIGTDYFMEIAKFRATRILWPAILNIYFPNLEPVNFVIHADSSKWSQTTFDKHTNILRGTTECMSAIIGGADTIKISPFDNLLSEKSEMADRLAINTQLVMREEAYFDKVVDPAKGSYFIERLTQQVAAAAWKLFQEIENEGGFLDTFTKGLIKSEIEAKSEKRFNHIALKKEILLGTNQYPLPNDSASSEEFPVHTGSNGTTPLPNAIFPKRGGQQFEALRREIEAIKPRPRVWLLPYGNLIMRRVRAQFATNFFNTSGFKVVENIGVATVEQGIRAAVKSKPSIIVFCSSDSEYQDITPELLSLCANDSLFVFAGNPSAIHHQLGNSTRIHNIYTGINVLETLQELKQSLVISASSNE